MKNYLLFFSVIFSTFLIAEKYDFNRIHTKEDLHLEDLEEFGFTPGKNPNLPDPKGAEEGIDTIFAGKGFRLYIPENLFKQLIVGGNDPKLEQKGQWVIYGNPPSPKSRKSGGRFSNNEDIGLSYALIEDKGEKYANFTCFQCHAGMVAGKLVAGLGNAHLDQSALVDNLESYKWIRDVYKMKLAPHKTIVGLVDLIAKLTDEKKTHLEFFTLYSETVLRPVLRRATTRGDDYGPYPVWQLAARLKDPTHSGFEMEPLESKAAGLLAREKLITDQKFGPVDRRPWWVRKHDVQSYVYGDTQTVPAAGKDFAINFTVPHLNTNDTYAKRSEEISSILTYALQSEAPPYPKPINQKLADKGEVLYGQDCARCHGTFERAKEGPQKFILHYRTQKYAGKNPAWAGKTLPYILYGTKSDADPTWTEDTDLTYSRALQIWGGIDPDTGAKREASLTSHLAGLRSYLKTQFKIPEDKLPAVYSPKFSGYRAPPLVGVWASAPYLHNGSVPTLKELFEADVPKGQPARRPIWIRDMDVARDASYDFDNVGLLVEDPPGGTMPPKPTKASDPAEYRHVHSINYRRIYDTSRPGYSNKGARTCGPNLKNDADKNAVIEFLKSLDDATVRPEGPKDKWGQPL